MRPVGLFIASVLAASACGTDHAPPPKVEGPLAQAMTASAARSGSVPRDLLVAIASVEQGLTIPKQRVVEIANAVPAAGPLQLRHGRFNSLARAAVLANTTELELRQNSNLALDAGALVLAELGQKYGATPNDLASWRDAVAELGGFSDDAHRDRYVRDVYAALAHGGSFPARDGETIVLPPHDIPPALTVQISELLKPLLQPEFPGPGTEWIETSCNNNKCDADRAGSAIEMVVIHDTEGNWESSVATLQNDSGKSVHYIVNTDGQVAQFVTEATSAFHAGNRSYNDRSVGIEHVNVDETTTPYPAAQYAASATLVNYLTQKYNIPRDRTHIIGHDQVPNGNVLGLDHAPCTLSPAECETSDDWGGANNHRDPGIVWEWGPYMALFGGTAKCNDVPTVWTCAIDKSSAFECNPSGLVEVHQCVGGGRCDLTGAPTTVCTPPTAGTPLNPGSTSSVPTTSNANPNDPSETSTLKAREPKAVGCAFAPSRESSEPVLLVAAALSLLVVRRRRHCSTRSARPCHHSP